MDERTYRAVSWAFDALLADLATLNKRATKLGVEPCRAVELKREAVESRDRKHPDVKITRTYVTFRIEGATPKLAGWCFQAKIEPTEAGNLVKLMPGVQAVPERFYTAGTDCDHCKSRRYRRETFVVKHEDGRYAQIGRTCLADFLGGTSPERLASMAEWAASIEAAAGGSEDEDRWSGGGSGGVDLGEPTPTFVAAVAAFARFEGWVSRSDSLASNNPSTREQAWRYLRQFDKHDREWATNLESKGFAIEARDVAIAEAAITWAKELDPKGNNFLHNLRVSATLEHADNRNSGILAAVVGCYLREVEKQEIHRKRREAGTHSSHVGSVGKRQVFDGLTCVGYREFPSDWGARTMVRFMDGLGNVFVWWTGERPDWVEQNGTARTVKATIKKHDEYQGEKQTVITRVATV